MARHGTYTTAVAALLLAAATVATNAFADEPPTAAEGAAEGCHEIFAMLGGDELAIREAVPDRYDLARDPQGRPYVWIDAIHCRNMVIDGKNAGPNTIAQLTPLIQPPDGSDCPSAMPAVGANADPLPVCSRYVTFWAHSNAAAVEWIRAGTPGFPVFHVRNSLIEDGEFEPGRLGSPFHFSARPPMPSPFRIDAIYRDRPGETPVAVEWYADTRKGIVRVSGRGELSFGDATGTVAAQPGSQMDRMLGGPRDLEAPGSLIGSVRWERLEVSKKLLSTEQPAPSQNSP